LFEGKCWHEFETVPYQVPSGFRGTSTKCKHCNKTYIQLKNYVYPDYSSPNTYLPFLQWFWKEKGETWEEFCRWEKVRDPWLDSEEFFEVWLFSLTDEGEPRIMVLLSEWLALPETREMWGWKECPRYEDEYCPCGFSDYNCVGNNKIKDEWAKEG
jgi:hypothetical protein